MPFLIKDSQVVGSLLQWRVLNEWAAAASVLLTRQQAWLHQGRYITSRCTLGIINSILHHSLILMLVDIFRAESKSKNVVLPGGVAIQRSGSISIQQSSIVNAKWKHCYVIIVKMRLYFEIPMAWLCHQQCQWPSDEQPRRIFIDIILYQSQASELNGKRIVADFVIPANAVVWRIERILYHDETCDLHL